MRRRRGPRREAVAAATAGSRTRRRAEAQAELDDEGDGQRDEEDEDRDRMRRGAAGSRKDGRTRRLELALGTCGLSLAANRSCRTCAACASSYPPTASYLPRISSLPAHILHPSYTPFPSHVVSAPFSLQRALRAGKSVSDSESGPKESLPIMSSELLKLGPTAASTAAILGGLLVSFLRRPRAVGFVEVDASKGLTLLILASSAALATV